MARRVEDSAATYQVLPELRASAAAARGAKEGGGDERVMGAAAFAARGVVRLSRLASASAAQSLLDALWRDDLAPLGLDRADSSTWGATLGAERLMCGAYRVSLRTRKWGSVVALRGALDAWSRAAFPGERWKASDMASAHVNFPAHRRGGGWAVPCYDAVHGGGVDWHVDAAVEVAAGAAAAAAAGALPPRPRLIKCFVLLGDVVSSGGATLCVTGSHRVLHQRAARAALELQEHQRSGVAATAVRTATWRTENSADARRDLVAADASGWCSQLLCGTLRDGGEGRGECRTALCARGATVDGVELRVEALTGRAGDAVLMDPRVLHSWSPNTSGVARVALCFYLERLSARTEAPVGV